LNNEIAVIEAKLQFPKISKKQKEKYLQQLKDKKKKMGQLKRNANYNVFSF
jgi:hypothetical protein